MTKQKPKTAAEVKFRDSVRVAKFEVFRVNTDNTKEVWSRWDELGLAIQEMTNMAWQQWLVWHLDNGSPARIREWLSAVKQWHNTADGERGDKPRLDLQAIPKELSNLIYHKLTASFPQVNLRTLVLVQNAIGGKITSRKSAHGNLPGWMSILICRESIPSSRDKQPIPFDKKSCTFVAPADKDGDYLLRFRIDRVEVPGKVNAISTLDEVVLRTKHRKAAGQKAILDNILTGRYAFCGSNLVWDARNRKWFVHIGFKRPVEIKEPGSGVAVLRPGLKQPWNMRAKGRTFYKMYGTGEDVVALRRSLLSQRWSRQEKYRHAGSAGKGHGRSRALAATAKIEQNWRNYVTTRNHTTTGATVRFCQENNIGTLIYIQPADGFSDSRFLAKAGKHRERRDSTGWDWHQVAAMLGYKCKDAGIHLIVKKHGASEQPAKEEVKKHDKKPIARKPARKSLSK